MTLTPIVLFVYSRLDHTKKVIEALKNNDLAKESKLFIFSDGPKTGKDKVEVERVRKYLKTIVGFKSVKIFESKKNKGLANSIIYGVTKIVNKYGSVIVLEDDIVTSAYFLRFMNDALEMYKDEKKVIGVSGYTYPIKGLSETFFVKNAECWGWATWKRGWQLFDENGKRLLKKIESENLSGEFNFNNSYDYVQMLKDQISGKNDSWAVRWYASAFINQKLSLYAGKSLVKNIGVDGTGTNGGLVDMYHTDLSSTPINVDYFPPNEDIIARKKFEFFFKKLNSRFFRAICFFKSKIKVFTKS